MSNRESKPTITYGRLLTVVWVTGLTILVTLTAYGKSGTLVGILVAVAMALCTVPWYRGAVDWNSKIGGANEQ